jgi:type IV pilus assembly protein PilA
MVRVVAGMFFIVVFLALLVLNIFYILTLYRALNKCSASSRTIEPGLVWLLLIPLFNLVWHFFVVLGLAKSLGNEFRARNAPNIDLEMGKSIGIAMCVCRVCVFIPILGILALPAYLVLWIIYWVKIAEFSRRLDQLPAADGATLYAPQDSSSGMPFSPPGTIPAPSFPPAGAQRSVPVFVWVLVGLAGFFTVVVVILVLIAIPTFGSVKKRANEQSAIQSIRAIQLAEMQYESTYPSNGYACSLAALGGDPSAGAPSPAAAQMLQGDLTSGYKSGYIFTVECTKATVNGTEQYTDYQITAVPQRVGKSGNRGFCSDQFGPIKADPAGGTNCTETVGQ